MTAKKIGRFSVKQVGNSNDRVLRFMGTDETPDRDGDIVSADGWDFSNYLKNPVFLWGHDYRSVPIGKCVAISRGSGSTGTSFDIEFATIEELCTDPSNPSEAAQMADTVYWAYKNGYLSAVSVGFVGNECEEAPDQDDVPQWMRGRKFTSQELLELSAVAVPANANALIQARSMKAVDKTRIRMLEKMFSATKGAIAYKKFPLADEGDAWDGAAVVKDADADDLKIICAWYDSADPDVKSSYKLPHHLGSADGHKTVWAGVKAAMGALLGARGGTEIPEADRKAVYDHLSNHYAEFEKDVPEFKAYSDAEIKTIMEGDQMNANEITKAIADAVAPLQTEIKRLASSQKAGAKHSAETLEKMDAACKHIGNGLAVLKGLMDGSGEEPGGQNPGENKPGTDRNGNVPAAGQDDEDDAAGKGIDLSMVNFSAYGIE